MYWQSKFESCAYSDSLLSKIYLHNIKSNYQINILEIKKAIYYAKKYHGSQKRLSGEPFYSHPIAVTELVLPFCFKTDILVTSILHDTIEDTTLTKEMIEYLFSSKVAHYVDSLTRVQIDRKISIEEMIDYLWQQRINDDLLLIKYFDRLHNLQTINFKPNVKIIKTIKETFKKFLSLSLYFKANNPEMSIIHQEMFDICHEQLANRPLDLTNSKIRVFQDHVQLPSLTSQNATPQTKNQ